MKKNKILAISILTTILSTTAIGMPIILSSCNNNSNNEDNSINKPQENKPEHTPNLPNKPDGGENPETPEKPTNPSEPEDNNTKITLLKDGCFFLYQGWTGSKLTRIKETNNFLYYTGLDLIEHEQFYCVREKPYLSYYLTPQQIRDLGFVNKEEPLSWDIHFITSKGKRIHFYSSKEMFVNYDKTKPFTLNLELSLMEGRSPSSLTHKAYIPFTITMIPGKYTGSN